MPELNHKIDMIKMETKIIRLEHIDFSYPGDSVRTLHNISLELRPGSFTVIIGPSGCGKSTLLKIASGIEKASRGSVSIHGNSSFVFQSGALLPWRDVEKNVFLGVETEPISLEQKKKRVRDAIKLMGMYDLEKEFPRNLSGGQRQRVGIARALATEPDILFLDEPFSALDPETTENLHRELLEIWSKRGMTVLMVSHSMEEAALLADTVIVMDKGMIKKKIDVHLSRPRKESDSHFPGIVQDLRLALAKAGSKLTT